MPTPLLISKSHMETFWSCARAGAHAYVLHDGGVQAVGDQFDLEYGKVMHEALAAVAMTPEQRYDLPLGPTHVRDRVYTMCIQIGRDDDNARQWAAIAEGSIRGFVASVWPKLMAEYEVVKVEVPCVLPLGEEIYYVAIPDLILRNKVTNENWYLEYKTTGARFDAGWIGQWDTAVQVHAGIRAAESTLGISIAGCVVVGLSKGYRNSYDNTQTSPFAYGYVRRGSPGVVPDQYQIERPKSWKGWEKFPTWTLTDGLGSWVSRMQQEAPQVLEAQYCVTPPILVRDDIVGQFLNQVRIHGRNIRHFHAEMEGVTDQAGADIIKDVYFPQTFSSCHEWPHSRRKCGYRDACWTGWVGEDPVGSGLYQARSVEHQGPFIKLIEVRA